MSIQQLQKLEQHKREAGNLKRTFDITTLESQFDNSMFNKALLFCSRWMKE